MSGNEKDIFNRSNIGNRPSYKTLKRFVDRKGYTILESVGLGETPKDKQVNGWEKYGIITQLQEKTGISRQTLYRIKSFFPTLESTGMPKGIWLKQEDYDSLKKGYSRLEEVEKHLNQVQKYFRSSLIVDLSGLQARREILGESLQLALKRQVKAGEKQESVMKKVFDDGLRELSSVIWDLRFVIY